jgi:hypothetical protein
MQVHSPGRASLREDSFQYHLKTARIENCNGSVRNGPPRSTDRVSLSRNSFKNKRENAGVLHHAGVEDHDTQF